jgi:peroxiredoxin family protein
MSLQIPTPASSVSPPLFAEAKPEPIQRFSIICSKGSLDMAYPGLILANAARMSGIEATLFFTFWGLDIVRKEKVDNLHVSTVGNPSMPMPTMLGGLPGMESLASRMMKKEIAKLDLPTIRELLQDLSDAGARLYACRMAMDMFHLRKEDLVPQVEEVISAMDFFDRSAGAQILFI